MQVSILELGSEDYFLEFTEKKIHKLKQKQQLREYAHELWNQKNMIICNYKISLIIY